MYGNLPEPYATRLSAIATDEQRGAAELTMDSAHLILELLDDELPPDSKVGHLIGLITNIATVKPSMASMINLANSMGLVFEDHGGPDRPEEGLKAASNWISEWLREKDERMARVIDQALTRLPGNGGTVACFSYSSTLGALLGEASSRGILWNVWVSEARPGHEGLALARLANGQGHRVTVTTDAALPGLLGKMDPEISAVVLGTDSLIQDRFINKSGTDPLVLSAARFKITVLVLTTNDKVLPSSLEHLLEPAGKEGRPPVEWSDLPRNIRLHNDLFESADLDLVKWIITESGVHRPGTVTREVPQRVCRWLSPP